MPFLWCCVSCPLTECKSYVLLMLGFVESGMWPNLPISESGRWGFPLVTPCTRSYEGTFFYDCNTPSVSALPVLFSLKELVF